VGTTFKDELAEKGVIFCSLSRSGARASRTRQAVPRQRGAAYGDNYFAALNSRGVQRRQLRASSQGRALPDGAQHLFPHQRANTGQFERTLIVREEGAYVSYLEGCTAPMRDENQLHAAVVELVALDDAEIKYSTVQNWYPGDENGVGGIYNFVTKRGECRGARSKISWTQVETGSAITWKYPSCVLKGDDSIGEFYSVALTHHRQQADTGTKMIHIGKGTKSKIVSKGISAGRAEQLSRPREDRKTAEGARNFSQCDSLLIGKRCGAHTFPYIEVKNPTRSSNTKPPRQDRRRPALLLPRPRHRRGRRGLDDRRRLLQTGLPRTADGIRGGSEEAAGSQPGGSGGMSRLRLDAPAALLRRENQIDQGAHAAVAHLHRRRGTEHALRPFPAEGTRGLPC
jgi:Fe-S cluster assembly protein SufB